MWLLGEMEGGCQKASLESSGPKVRANDWCDHGSEGWSIPLEHLTTWNIRMPEIEGSRRRTDKQRCARHRVPLSPTKLRICTDLQTHPLLWHSPLIKQPKRCFLSFLHFSQMPFLGTSLVVQWLRLCFHCRGVHPWSGTKILHASRFSQNKCNSWP